MKGKSERILVYRLQFSRVEYLAIMQQNLSDFSEILDLQTTEQVNKKW